MSRFRLFKSTLFYPNYLENYYKDSPEKTNHSFCDQVQALLGEGFLFGDAWKYYLESTGHYEVMEVVFNAEPAQKQWAKEHGIRHSEESWKEEILAAQLADFKPDIWFDMSWITPQQRLQLRQEHPSIRYVIGYDGAMNHFPDRLAGCDAVLSCVKESAAFYTGAGMKGYWLPWGFDPRIGAKLKPAVLRTECIFCGGMDLNSKWGHFGRVELLDRLRRDFKLEICIRDLNEYAAVERVLLSSIRHRNYATAWKILRFYPLLFRLRSINTGSCYGLAMYQRLAEAKVALNRHADAANTAANIRLFETTGVGTCLLTDWKDDLPEVFEPNKEVVTFRSNEECAEKLRYLLDHDNVRRSIAAAGQKRCFRDHNIGHHILAFADQVLDKL